MKGRSIQVGGILLMFVSLNITFASNIKFMVYNITNCNGKVTHMYVNPTVHSEKIASIPADEKGIKSSLRKVKYGQYYWQKISWNSKIGWVFADKLKRDSG